MIRSHIGSIKDCRVLPKLELERFHIGSTRECGVLLKLERNFYLSDWSFGLCSSIGQYQSNKLFFSCMYVCNIYYLIHVHNLLLPNLFRLDFGPEHTKARELMDVRAC